MLNSIIERNKLTKPLNETEIKIIKSAIKLFLENGYSKTTLRKISDDCGMLQGRVAYHFHTKEDMLHILIQELMDYHGNMIDNFHTEVKDNLLAYAMEIAAQISLCDRCEKVWDLYYSAYTHPATFIIIKDWAARKNYLLLHRWVPDWNETKFREIENITSCIELSAFTTPTDKSYTLEHKITDVLDSVMKIYDIPEKDRKETIKKVLALDYEKISKDMFDKFAKRLDNEIENLE